jgi:hypothetical protein
VRERETSCRFGRLAACMGSTAVTIKNAAFWAVMTCSIVEVY